MLPNDAPSSRPRTPPEAGTYNPLRHYGINMAIRPEERERKPRVRHTDAQLAALNNLYEENEHPSLEERALLADSIGMYVHLLKLILGPIHFPSCIIIIMSFIFYCHTPFLYTFIYLFPPIRQRPHLTHSLLFHI